MPSWARHDCLDELICDAHQLQLWIEAVFRTFRGKIRELRCFAISVYLNPPLKKTKIIKNPENYKKVHAKRLVLIIKLGLN